MVPSDRSSSDLSEYTQFQYLKIFSIYKNRFLGDIIKKICLCLAVFFFKLLSKFNGFINSDDCIGKIHHNLSEYIQFLFKNVFEFHKKGIISNKTSYICTCSDFHLTNMKHLFCNFYIYVSFYAANMITQLIY